MAVLVGQAADDLATGIVGIGDEQHRLRQLQGGEEVPQFIEQRAPVAVGKHEAFVNPRRERDRLKTFPDLDQQSERLARMAHDGLGFGVGVRSLMQGFYRRHLFAGLGFFPTVGEEPSTRCTPGWTFSTTRTQVRAKASTQSAGR